MAARGEDFHVRIGYRRSRFAGHLWKTTALSTLALALSGAAAYGDDTGLWQPQIRAIIGADNNGGNAALEGFIPIKQTAESVLFLDVRAKHDFKNAFGQDVGLGIRRIVNPDLMIGGYAYLNVENYNSTQFTAATLGAEAITSHFDAHVNVFLPIKGDNTDHSVSSSLSMVSNQLIEQISVLDHRDYAAWGVEGEIGAQVPLNLPDKHSLRLDIGGYHFEDPHGDDASVTGAKAGFEYTIGDVFGSGTSLVFAGEVRNDNRDDTQFSGSVRLNIPFNPDRSSGRSDSGGVSAYPVSEGLRKRVNERVRGDIGVRIQSQELGGGSTTRVAINAATNAAFGKFYFADGGLAGAGTQADPTTLDDAVTKAGAGGFVVALGGNGNLTTSGVTLATGQTVIGGGESVTAKLFDGSTTTFNLGGSDGTIQGTNLANNVITLGNGNTLNGITITGGADGIFGNNITGATLTKVTVDGAGGNGAEFTGNSTNVKASDFTARNNGLDGLHIEDNGTYNFTGTTLLQGNADDGLDITGQGTYTFATVNAFNNTDRGITVQGTSSGGSFTTTGGNISGNGGIGVYIDPITAHVVLDSISQTGGPAGVVLDHVSGSFTVNGATTIANTMGPAIAISNSPATIRFGDINITNPGADGMSFAGVNAAVVAGNIVISGLGVGQTGLDFSGSQTNFTAQSLNITAPGAAAAGSIGIDLADTTGGASIIITNGGSISGVDTGVRLGISGSLAHSANAEFTFGGTSSSIVGATASLDARGLNQTLGLYAFGSTTFGGPQLFDPQNVIFVGSTATGSGDGSSLSDLASFTTANAITDSDAIFVLVNDGTSIDASNGFSLSDGQTLASFGNGRTFSLGGVPINVTGDDVVHDQVVSDPAGAATLTNSGAGAVVTAANGNSLLDFNISGGTDEGINATSINGLTIQGVTVSNVAVGLALGGVTGTISVDDLNVQNASQTGIALVGSSATVNFTGNTTIGNATNAGLFANNFDGTATFDDLDIAGGGIGVGIANDSNGTLTFGAGSSIAGTSSNAFSISNSTPNVTYNGTISQTSAASAVKISSMTGGTATFGGKITASTGAANAIDLSTNAGGAINFTGGLDLTTDGGFAFSAINGGTLTVTGSGNTVNTGAGVTENGIQLGGASGLTIGAAGVTFASVTVDGSGGTVPAGIVIENTSGGNVTFGGVNISRVNGDAIRLTNVASGTYSFNGTTTIATVVGGGPGFVVQGSAATVSVNNLVTSGVSGADVSLSNNTGTIGIGGTITNSGTGDGVVVSGGTAAITVSADISSSATAPGTAVKVDGISGGSVTFSGAIGSTGTGRLFAIGSAAFLTGGTISFTGPSLSATGGGGASAIDLIGTAKLNVTAPLSITNPMSTGLVVGSVGSTASATFGAVTVTGAGPGIAIADTAGSVTFGTTQVTLGSAANVAGINFSFTNADVSFGTTTVTMGAGANQSGISFATASADASFGATTVTMGAGANQTGINFSGAFATADFGVTAITGNGDLTSRGIDLSSTQADKTITFQAGSSITNVGVGVELSSGGTTATSANANFTFGDGNAGNGLQSSISAAAGGYTVNTIGLNPALGNYDFDDVLFTGSAHLASAVGGVIMVSQSGGVIAAGTNGLSAAVTTISVAAADAMAGTQTFAFVGTVDLSATPFTLDSGQSITGFGNGNAITTAGTIQPVNVQGNLGATGGNVTGDEGVVTGTGDFLHLLGSNQVRNTAFDFSGASGSVFTVDQSAGGFNNAGGIVIEGVTVSNVAAGSTAFKVAGLDTSLSILNNNVNVAGTLLDANGGTGNITVTRGTLPNSATPGTLTGGGISIANRSGGLVDFTDKVTIGGNGVSLTGNTGSTVTFADIDVTTNGTTAFTATGGGTVNVTTGTINAASAQAVALAGITAGINFTSTSASFGTGSGIDLQDLSGTAAFGTGTLTNTGSGASFNVGSATNLSGGNAVISYVGTIASNGTGAAVSVQELTGGSVTLSGNLTDNNAAAGGNIVVAGIDNGTAATVAFSGATKQISSGATDGVSLTGNPNGTIDFSNGGLAITTTTATGFHVASAGTVSVTGSGNTITTTTGTALDLGNATVGAGGVTFDSISVNGAATGVSLNNVSGGALGLGVVNLQNITSRGIDISGTLGAAVNATSINIGLNAINAIGLDLNGATLGTSNITAGDFDVDGGGFAGTIGIDMAGTTGAGTIQLGDTVNNNPGPVGQTSTISNVGYGVQFSSATNANLVFGDGQGPAESSIATTGGQVIHATDTLPTNGNYNFNDVNFTGDISNLSTISVYYVVEGGTGDGSLANPGSYIGAQASTANVVVLIDKNVNGSQETIDLSGTSFQLDDGQVLLAFKSGDAAVDVSQLGVDASGGAGASFHFTTVQNSTVVSAPAGIDTLRPVLQSNNATSVINLATSGTGIFTGGVDNLIIRNTGTGTGIAVNATAASSFFLWNNDIAAGGRALDFATSGAPANTLLLSIDGNTLQSTGSALAASFAGQNVSATQNSIAVRSFAGNTVTGGTGGGIAFNNVTFDSTGAGGTVSVGTLDIGTTGARVQGNGLNLTNTSGTLDLGTFTVANNGGTGLLVNTKGANTTFTLNSSGGSVDTTNGTALDLDPLTVNMTVGSVTASGGTSGILFDQVAGTFSVTGATTITGTLIAGISATNSGAGTFNFNTVTVDNTSNTGGGIGWLSGTLNITGLANIDTISGAGVSQGGGTTNFTGGLTIDTTSGAGISGSGGTMTIAATGGAETVNSTGGRAINLSGVAATIALDSTSSGGGANNVSLTNVTGTVGLGAGALSGASGASFNVSGGTATVTYSGNITQANNAALVSVSGGNNGSLTFNTGTLSATNGTGLQFDNADGTYNFNGTTTLNGGDAGIDITNGSGGTFTFSGGTSISNPSGVGFLVSGGTSTVTYNGTVSKSSTGKVVDISGVTGGTIALTGNLTASGAVDNGIFVHGNTGGSFTFGGGTKSLTTGAFTAVNLVTNTGATVSFTGGGLAINTTSGIGFNATGGGTINVTGSGNTVQTAGGQILNWNGMIVGGSGATFASLQSTASVAGDAINLTGVSGGTFNGGTVSVAGTSASGDGIEINASSAAFNFTSATVSATAGNGILLSGANGAVTFTTVTIDNTTLAGIRIDNNTNAVNVNGGSIGATNDPTGVGVDINGGSGAVTIAASVAKTTAGNIVQVSGHTAGTVLFSGSLSATGGVANGIDVSSNSGTAVINFTNASKTLNTGTNTAVNLTNNTGATVNFTGGGLAITTTSATGFNATGGGTVTVQGAVNTINSTTGTALNVSNTTIGASGLTFQSISANGAVNGIVLNNTGANGLTVTGNGVTSGGLLVLNGTGGTIQNTTGDSVVLTNAFNVNLRQMNITNAGLDGVQSVGGGNIKLSAVNITNPGASSPASDGSSGNPAGFGGGNGWFAQNLTGVNAFDNNSRVSGWQSSQSNGVVLYNTDTNFTSFTIDHALFTTSATGADGFLANLFGTTSGTVNVTSSEFTLIDQDAVQISNQGSGTVNAIVQKNNFHDADNTGGDGNNTLYLSNSANGILNFTIGGPTAADGNTFNNLARLTTLAGVVQVDAAGGSAATPAGGQINGSISNNTIGNDVGFVNGRRAIDVQVEADSHNLGKIAVAISNNTINNVSKQGVHISVVSVGGGSVTDANWTILNNHIGDTSPVGTEGNVDSGSAIEFETNFDSFTSGADMVNNLLIQGNIAVNNANNATGATLDITNIGGTAASGTTAVLNATILNNVFINNAATGHVLDVLNSSAGDGETLNLNISGNNTTLGASALGEIRLRQLSVGGTFNIQGGFAAVSTNNNGDTVNSSGSFGTVGSVTLPSLPTGGF